MTRYYFHVRRGRATVLDNAGVELADLKEATKEAVRRAVEIEAGNVTGSILVDDELRVVLEVPLEGTLMHLRNRPKPSPLP